MNTGVTPIKRALISVSKKDGVLELAQVLNVHGVEIISTGGTAKMLQTAGIPVKEISQFTGFPEIMNGRVKTLHPLVHGGILGLRDEHADVAAQNNIQWIDLVVCNLYPFSETLQKPNVSEDELIENIDIGGPSMIRSAAKNVGWVGIVVDNADYALITQEIKNQGGLTYQTRKNLSAKAFAHTAAYDAIIAKHFNTEKFPQSLTLTYQKYFDPRYGENPHQAACVYKEPNNRESNILNAKIIQEFTDPACAVIKHQNPCGACQDQDITTAFKRAYAADALSAFGGVIALNRVCNQQIAQEISQVFAEIVIAPSFEQVALEILAQKKNLRVLELGEIKPLSTNLELKQVDGGILTQEPDIKTIALSDLKFVTQKRPTDNQIQSMLFAWKILKHIKSNAILIAKDNVTVGVGAGQVSRVDAVDIAIKKSGDQITGAILASDAFFPFRDSIDKIAAAGITAIIQPGGSIKDEEVIAACNEKQIAMVFTGTRCFKH